jgi:hypothetical protein
MHDQLYLLLDAARVGSRMEEAFGLNKEYDSLYRLSSQQNLATVAPYIFSAKPGSAFFNWYLENGPGNSWGVLVSSAVSMEDLHKHFRKILMVSTEDKKKIYFRFYDPRVLKMFLPTCNAQQILEFFGPVKNLLLEGALKNEFLKYWQENGTLKTNVVNASEVFGRMHSV